MDPFDGVLLIDKPSGPTSHDIVDGIRRTFKFKKVGHAGTLDPMATGLLVMLIGRATKLSQVLMGSDKVYEGAMELGAATDTQDAEGARIEEKDCSFVTREMLESEMRNWVGDIMQIPPMVSAIKQNGVPLYKLARKGKTVERKPRLIHVYEFKLLSFDLPQAQFRLASTKGTYVRTICHDVGANLGCGAFLAQLRRTKSGALDVKDATPFEAILSCTRDELLSHIIPISALRREDLI
ncbi:MAG: tRNA pseudouridine(55) synthase TruB [Spartobacteria bacterium]|nr:tRNA pseudouridine(55) synthase TruB [Spartobacteria bacterium]